MNGFSAILREAVRIGNLEVVRLLVENGEKDAYAVRRAAGNDNL